MRTATAGEPVARASCSECGDGLYIVDASELGTCYACGNYVDVSAFQLDAGETVVSSNGLLAIAGTEFGEPIAAGGDYFGAVARVSVRDGLPVIQRALWDRGIVSTLDQTGGFCMVLRAAVPDSGDVVIAANDGDAFNVGRMPAAVYSGESETEDSGDYAHNDRRVPAAYVAATIAAWLATPDGERLPTV